MSRLFALATASIAILAALLGFELVQSKMVLSENSSIDAPLDITEAPKEVIRINVGAEIFLSIGRSGGTGFSWKAKVDDPTIAAIAYVLSRSAKKTDLIVGAPESDVFKLKALRPGRVKVVFDLSRVRSGPVESQNVLIEVLGPEGGNKT